ncbi:HNH endonuclease [Adonisia turfae]|nr:HNH endonuclease [Adonisia turfae]
MIKQIPLTQSKFALVDSDVFDDFSQFKWHVANGYAARRLPKSEGKKIVYMHRLIMKAVKGQVIDHVNGNVLDNRRENLRICSHKQNIRNGKSRGGSSIYKGVSKRSDYDTWQAHITVDGKKKNLGCHKNEQDAAKAYDAAALEYFGEFANLNLPANLIPKAGGGHA